MAIQTLYIMCGVGFAGKTTLAKEIARAKGVSYLSQDDTWFEKEKIWNLDEDSDQDWNRVLDLSKERLRSELASGKSVVFDHTSLRRSDRDALRVMARTFQAKAVLVYLDTPVATQVARQLHNHQMQHRHKVKQEHLDSARLELEIPGPEENPHVFTPDTPLDDWLRKLP